MKLALKWLNWVTEPLHLISLTLTAVPIFILLIFVRLHGENIIWGDELTLLDILVAIKQGTFLQDLPEYLLKARQGHPLLPTLIRTSFLIWLFDYNVLIGLALNILTAFVIFLLIVLLFRESAGKLTVFVLPVFSALVFAVHQDHNWLINFFGFWFTTTAFFLGALWVLAVRPVGWRSLSLAAVLTIGGTLTTTSHIVAWVLLIFVLVVRGYRNLRLYVAWIGIAAVAIFIARLLPTGSQLLTVATVTSRLGQFAVFETQFTLMYLGGILVSRFYLGTLDSIYLLAMIVGGIGVAGLLFNAVYLWRVEDDKKTVVIWLVVALYAALTGAGIGLGRVDWINLDKGWSTIISIRPFIAWYATVGLQFWVAYVALASLVIWKATSSTPQQFVRRGVALVNAVIFGVFATLFIIQNQRIEATSFLSDDPASRISGTPIDKQCLLDFTYYLDETCTGEWLYSTHILAGYKVNIFAHLSPISVIPPEAQGFPLLIETESEWHSAHIRDWWLAGTDLTQVLFVMPTEGVSPKIPYPIQNKLVDIAGEQRADLTQFLQGHEIVWLLKYGEAASNGDYLELILIELGYHAEQQVNDTLRHLTSVKFVLD